MNEIRRPVREADEIAAIRAVVERHRMPEFVTGFEVLLSTVDGEPAVWIVFHTVGVRPDSIEGRKARADEANELVDSVHGDLREQVSERYPYYRFHPSDQD